jgi:hypothetical protein
MIGGIFMAAINASLLAAIAVIAVLYFSTLDRLKVWLFRRLELR